MAKKELEENKKEELDLTKVKEELTNYIDGQIKKGFKEELANSHNKLIRYKNWRLFWKNVIIIVLLFIIMILLYLLYDNKYFDKYFDNGKVVINDKAKDVINNSDNKENEVKKVSKEDLIKEYSYLLDDIEISDKCIYLKDYYNGNLTNELKNYLSLNQINFSKLVVEEDSQIIDNDILESAYSKLFNSDYNNISFDYNGIKVKYIKGLNAYLTDKELVKEESNIVKEIVDIEVNNNIVKISTVEGIIKDNKLYNVLTKSEVKKYNKNELISIYESKLNKITYIFNNEKLENISK